MRIVQPQNLQNRHFGKQCIWKTSSFNVHKTVIYDLMLLKSPITLKLINLNLCQDIK